MTPHELAVEIRNAVRTVLAANQNRGRRLISVGGSTTVASLIDEEGVPFTDLTLNFQIRFDTPGTVMQIKMLDDDPDAPTIVE